LRSAHQSYLIIARNPLDGTFPRELGLSECAPRASDGVGEFAGRSPSIKTSFW
jgi:hypothetical protein